MATIHLANIDKSFDGQHMVISDLNLAIEDGEFIVLVGPSGCGKSTTLRLIAGLEAPSAGEIFIGKKDVTHIPPKDRGIAMVFQNYALYPHMTVFDNLAFGLKLRKYKKEDIRKRVGEAAAILEIEHLLERKPRQLSGGQRQRVALGRAIVRKPRVFLFDEPLSNLDAKLRVQMRTEIKKLHQRLGTTMVYVTHDQTEAMTMGKRIAIMKDGIIHQVDTPLQVYRHPANLFVAGFIGSPPMNFMSMQLLENNRLVSLEEDLEMTLLPDHQNRITDPIGKKLTLGIRPEDIEIEAQADTDIPITATVELFEPLGSETVLYLKTKTHHLVCKSNAFRPDLEINESIPVYLNAQRIYLFDTETGTRIQGK